MSPFLGCAGPHPRALSPDAHRSRLRARTRDLLSRQRDLLNALRSLLLENRTGHVALGVELEFEEGAPRILEARLRPGEKWHLRVVARLHQESVPLTAEGRGESGRRRVL